MKYILVLFSMLSGMMCMAQDLIYKKDKSVLMVTIITIGSENITYKDFNNPGPELSIGKSEVIKIKTASGKEILMEQGSSTSFDSKNAIKTDIASLLMSKFSLAFEHSISPTKTWEIQVGYIGVGLKDDFIYKLNGGFVRFGFKFKRSPEYYSKRGKSTHLLKGSYIKPELVFGGYSEESRFYDWVNNPWYDPYTYDIRSVVFGALMLNVGKQWTFGDALTLDYYFGLGISNAKTDYNTYHYAMAGIAPLVGQTGLKLGVMF